MRIALKVDVCSRQGAEQCVQNLLALLEQYDVKASFFFSTCLESSNSAILHALSGVFGKTSRTHETTPSPALSKAVLAVLEAGHAASSGTSRPSDPSWAGGFGVGIRHRTG